MGERGYSSVLPLERRCYSFSFSNWTSRNCISSSLLLLHPATTVSQSCYTQSIVATTAFMLNPSVAATFAGGNNYHRGNSAAPLNMLSHPPSRLSPPPGADIYGVTASSSSQQLPVAGSSATYPTQLPQTAAPLTDTKKQGQNLPKRGYRACVSIQKAQILTIKLT